MRKVCFPLTPAQELTACLPPDHLELLPLFSSQPIPAHKEQQHGTLDLPSRAGLSTGLERERRLREGALFDLAIDGELRGCDLVKVPIRDPVSGGRPGRQRS